MGVSSRFGPDQPGHFGCSYIHVRIQSGDWESGPLVNQAIFSQPAKFIVLRTYS